MQAVPVVQPLDLPASRVGLHLETTVRGQAPDFCSAVGVDDLRRVALLVVVQLPEGVIPLCVASEALLWEVRHLRPAEAILAARLDAAAARVVLVIITVVARVRLLGEAVERVVSITPASAC